jgi:hypothetical protein
LAGLGDAKGMGALRDESMLEVEILGEYNAETERATPRFEAMVKMPGHSLSERTLIKLARHSHPVKPTETPQKQQLSDSEYLQRVYDLEFDLGDKKPSDSPMNDKGASDSESGSEIESDVLKPLPNNVSGGVSDFVWSVRRVSQMFQNVAPEQLFVSVSDAALSGANIRHIIKSVLKCGEKNDHPTRSYSRHGKTLLKWLIENYDNGEISQLPKIQEFLRGNNDA